MTATETSKKRRDFIYETPYWEVFLNPDQYYLGRLVVVAKRDVGFMSDLTKDEWLDFLELSKKIESSFKKDFGATMFNWTCLMNHAYQVDNPKPRVHWHFRARYSKPVTFQGITFEDKEFGHHYANGTNNVLPLEIENLIIKKAREALNNS